ncbi:MAG: PspC domain-containing protein [Prevotellaceae bacterium]|jgi:phage shock protein PspC (stress-responsive transcriptional regulator)|nr:PspC domain-containing protein [Prevotellaceae bacterium]
MKTTVKVSISGIAFTVDEDAYHVLNNYLNTLKAHFNRKAGGKEVVDDIEARLAELLSMRISPTNHIVTLADAKEVTRIMGNPSDLIGNEGNNGSEPIPPVSPVTVRKRLYRDPDDHIVAGVCSGLGNYFNIDPVIFRIIFVVCAIGVGVIPFINGHHNGYFTLRGFAIWAYIILWIAVPQANTPQQKLEMEGKNPSIDDIEQRVRNEQQKTCNWKDNRKDYSSLAGCFGGMVRIFVIFIAGCLLFVGAVILIALIATILGFSYRTSFSINDIFDIVGINSLFVKTLLAIVIIYPLSMLIYWGAKLLFRFKLRDKAIMITAFLIWLFSVILLGGYGANIAWNEAESRRKSISRVETIDIKTPSKTLYLNLPEMYRASADDPLGEVKSNDNDTPRIWLDEFNGKKMLFVVPPIKIRYSSNVKDYQIELRKRAFGRNKRKANQQIEETKLDYTQTDSLLLISPLMFNKENPLHKMHEYYDIIIHASNNRKVIIQEPLLSKSTGSSYRHSRTFTIK